MRLETGRSAIPFTAQTVDGESISLAQYSGKPLLLMFFRYASCPMCNLRLHDFARQYERLEARGLRVVAFFHSPASEIRAHAGRRRYPFPLVADPDFHVYRSYGVETSWSRLLRSGVLPRFYVDWARSLRHGFWGGAAWRMATMPADFLIGADGRIVRAHYGRDIGDHLPLADIESYLNDPDGAAHIPPIDDTRRAPSKGGTPTRTTSLPALVVISLLWALALIASSYFLKGYAAGEWVDAMLYLAAGVWIADVLGRPGRVRGATSRPV